MNRYDYTRWPLVQKLHKGFDTIAQLTIPATILLIGMCAIIFIINQVMK